MSSTDRDKQLIQRLREQVHKSFMQISQMEKLFHLEMEHTKEEFDERERLIKQKQDDIKQKYALIQTNMRLKQSSFLMDMGELDMSMDEIAYRKEDTMRDSGIEKIKELLATEEKISNTDPQAQMNKLRELQLSITSCVPSVPAQLYQLFQIKNCRLKEELLNYQDTHDVYKTQILQCERMIQKLKRSERNLKQHNQQLNDLYVQEASQNAIVEEEIRLVREQLNHKKIEIDGLKEQVVKLSQLYKTSNKIDTTKINFKYPLNNKSRDQGSQKQKQKPSFLRMSSNAVLIRNYKCSTPQTTTSQESDAPLSTQAVNSQQGPKYFKRKMQKIDRIDRVQKIQKLDKIIK